MTVNEEELRRKKDEGERVTVLTAYDALVAEIADGAGVDVLLVGDSMGNVRLGHDSTLPVGLEESLSASGAVARGADRAMVVGDMPFGSYGGSVERSFDNASRYLERGANAVKLETPVGGEVTVDLAARLTELGVPVMGHTGLTPQHVNRRGYGVRGREDADALLDTARRLDDAGVFSLVLESVPEDVGRRVTEEVSAPTIGIGAGRHVDGQVLVTEDLLGLTERAPSFARRYADLRSTVADACEAYVEDVRAGEFPSEDEVFDAVDD